MDALLQPLLTFVLVYKYWAIFLVTFLAAAAIPVPAGAVLLASGFFIAEGYLSPWAAFLAGFLGNVCGDNAGYWFARRYGEPVLARVRLGWVLRSSGYRWAEARIGAHPAAVVFASRFTTALTLAVNLLAGLGKLAYARYLVPELLGEAIYVAAVIFGGYAFGENWDALRDVLGNVGLVALVAVAIAVGLAYVRRRRIRG